jgi:hypothetical protein
MTARDHEGSSRQASLVPLSAIRGRHPDDLNEGLVERYDGAHPSRSKHAFEWWYFDGKFSDGHTFAGTIQPGEPQIYMHINTPAGREMDIRVDHPREQYTASGEGCDVSCAGNSVRGAYPVYEVHMSGEGVEVELRFESLLPGWARGNGEVVIGGYGDPEVFGWCVAQPRARVSGTIAYDGQVHQVEGEGYHDHNWGDFSYPKYLSHWHWGRIHRPDITLVFADIATTKACGSVHYPIMLIARGDRLVFETYEMEWTYGDYRLDADGLQAYPRQIGFTFAERDVSGRLSFTPMSVLETDDMLKDAKVPHWLEGAIGRTYAQPVYFRLDSTYEGEIHFGEEVVPVSGDTIIEYMVFTLRRGQEPDDSVYLHALHPPKLARLHSEE